MKPFQVGDFVVGDNHRYGVVTMVTDDVPGTYPILGFDWHNGIKIVHTARPAGAFRRVTREAFLHHERHNTSWGEHPLVFPFAPKGDWIQAAAKEIESSREAIENSEWTCEDNTAAIIRKHAPK